LLTVPEAKISHPTIWKSWQGSSITTDGAHSLFSVTSRPTRRITFTAYQNLYPLSRARRYYRPSSFFAQFPL